VNGPALLKSGSRSAVAGGLIRLFHISLDGPRVILHERSIKPLVEKVVGMGDAHLVRQRGTSAIKWRAVSETKMLTSTIRVSLAG